MNDFSKPAVRNGDVYCAPWCGGGCTWKAFQKATRDAQMLCDELGDGWVPDVSENLGWHYKAVCGVLEVSPTIWNGKVSSYTCFVQTNPQFIGDGKTAKRALQDAGNQFNAVVDALMSSLSQAKQGLAGSAVRRLRSEAA